MPGTVCGAMLRGGMLQQLLDIVVVVMLAVPTTKPTTLSAVQCKGQVTSTERCQLWSVHRPLNRGSLGPPPRKKVEKDKEAASKQEGETTRQPSCPLNSV